MILILKKNHTNDQKNHLLDSIKALGGEVKTLNVQDHLIFAFEQNLSLDFLAFTAVQKVISTHNELKKTSRDAKKESTVIKIKDYELGPGRFLVISGPCSIESEDQALRLALQAKKAGAHVFRGGAFKPRTSPYTFQGLGHAGLEILSLVKKETGLAVVTEVLDVRDVEAICEVTDIIQIGSRNMQNFPLLKEAGKLDKPVLLKRGLAATIEEWLHAAEYIMNCGNEEVILCERGIRSFDQETRNFLDLTAIPIVNKKSHLPVIVDPSHALGRPDLIEPMTKAAMAVGAHGVMIEIHDHPETALSDGFQALLPIQLENIIYQLKKMGAALDIYLP